MSFLYSYLGILLLAISALGQTTSLSFRPIDARYSKELDRIIAVSASPPALHIYNPAMGQDTIVTLPLEPKSVSVGPSGLYAAVAHTGKISYVNLALGRIERQFNVNAEGSVVLAAQFVHVLPFTSINLTTGAQSKASEMHFGSTGGALHPGGRRVYGTLDGYSPNDLNAFEASTGPITGYRESPYHGDYAVCGRIWFSDDGKRIFNSCATFFRYDSDPQKDMYYGGRLDETGYLNWMAMSASAGRIAVIPFQGTSFPPGDDSLGDSELRFFDYTFLRRLGTAALPDFQVGASKYKAHGKWVFYNAAGTALYVVMQADSASGLANDFAIHKISSAAPAGCTFTLESAATTAPAHGGSASIQIASPAHCLYQAKSAQSWIQISRGAYSAGSGKLSYSVSANTSGVAREGSIDIGGQTFQITQAPHAVPDSNPMYRLGIQPVNSAYSKVTGNLILATANPNQVHIFDPKTRSGKSVELSLPPTSLSVSPSGGFAAVGHYGWISYVNLTDGGVEKQFAVPIDVESLVLAANGYIYALSMDQAGELVTIHIATGYMNVTNMVRTQPGAIPDPSGQHIYLPFGTVLDISTGQPRALYQYYSLESCGRLWPEEGGEKVITGCGMIYRPPVPGSGWLYLSELSPGTYARSADHSSAQHMTAVVPLSDQWLNQDADDTQFRLYEDESYSQRGQLTFPVFPGGTKAARGRSIFWSADSQSLYAILQADPEDKLTDDYAIWTASPALPNPGCVVGLAPSSGSVPGTGGTAQISVTSGPSCVWKAVSSANWLTVQGGSFGVDAATIRYTAQPNFTTVARTATITVGGSSFTLTQAAGSPDLCVYTLSSTTVATPSTGLAVQASITVQGTNCTWNVSSNASWAQVFPLSGTGSKTLYLTIFPNFTTKSRTAAITVAGQAISLSQAGNAASAGERFVRLLYFNHFGRQPSSEEVNGHISSGLPRGQLAINFMSSLEFATGGRYVAGLYKGILSRDPEFSGWLFQRNAMVTGTIAPLTLVSSFLGSEEFRVKYGSPSNAEFVRILYRNILLREPSQQEVDFQAGALAGLSRSQLTSNLLNSTEFRNGVGPRLTAFLLYSVLMSRGGSQSELGSVETQLKGSTSLRTLVDGMLNSPEFSSLLQ